MKTITTLFIALCVAVFAGGVMAKGGKKDKITIIHKPDFQANEITINENALPAHLRHGDCIVGDSGEYGCDSEPPAPVCINTAGYEEIAVTSVLPHGEIPGLNAVSVTVDEIVWTGVVCSAEELDAVLDARIAVLQHLESFSYLSEIIVEEFNTYCEISDSVNYAPESGEVAFDIGELLADCDAPTTPV